LPRHTYCPAVCASVLAFCAISLGTRLRIALDEATLCCSGYFVSILRFCGCSLLTNLLRLSFCPPSFSRGLHAHVTRVADLLFMYA